MFKLVLILHDLRFKVAIFKSLKKIKDRLKGKLFKMEKYLTVIIRILWLRTRLSVTEKKKLTNLTSSQ